MAVEEELSKANVVNRVVVSSSVGLTRMISKETKEWKTKEKRKTKEKKLLGIRSLCPPRIMFSRTSWDY